MITPNCRECARWSTFPGTEVACRRCEAAAAKRAREQQAANEVGWFKQTGHCGRCGDPGSFCTCTDSAPCGCRDLHDMGSARLADALDAFMPTVVHVDQAELFGGDT